MAITGRDARPAFTTAQRAFGVSATVIRPAPNPEPLEGVTVVWLGPGIAQVPFGVPMQRTEAKRVLALSRAEVPTVPTGTVILAPETRGGETKAWRVDGLDTLEPDHVRVLVVESPEDLPEDV